MSLIFTGDGARARKWNTCIYSLICYLNQAHEMQVYVLGFFCT